MWFFPDRSSYRNWTFAPSLRIDCPAKLQIGHSKDNEARKKTATRTSTFLMPKMAEKPCFESQFLSFECVICICDILASDFYK